MRHATDAGGVRDGSLEFGGVFCGTNDDHADAHVEGAEHLFIGNVAEALHKAEDGRFGPRAAAYFDRDAFGENARDVLEKAAARDVC